MTHNNDSKVPTHAAAPGELLPSAIYDAPVVELLWDDTLGGAELIESLTPQNPTIEDREVNDDGTVLEYGYWPLEEADELLSDNGYIRTGDWELTGGGYYLASIEAQ